MIGIEEESRPGGVSGNGPPVASYREAVREDSRRRTGHKSILLIEDEPLNRQVITRYLGVLGYRVRQAERGDEGLNLALEEEPDLLILDRQLPGLEGLDLVSRLREEGRSTPVVMISAYDISPADQKRVKALEIRGFLRKPFSYRHLRAVIRSGFGKPRLGFRRSRIFYREPYFFLTPRSLAQRVFRTVFREGLDMAGHVHFHVNNHSDHLILLCSQKTLGKVVAKSEQCGPGECIPWDRSSFHDYNQEKVLKNLSQEINLVRIDAADYQMSWPTLADFICWLELSD
jgi:CheY-like chemotaxis protein